MNQPLKNVRSLIDRLGLDAAVIVSRANKFYLTGYEYDEGYLFISSEGIQLFVDPRFSIYARNRVPDAAVIESKQPMIELNRHLKKLRHIGFDGSALLHKDFMVITSALSRQKFLFIEQHLLKMRAVKTADEVNFIKKASSASGAAIKRLIRGLSSGLTEKQVAAMLNLELINAGADDISFETVIAFDERAAYAHAIPSNSVELAGKRLMLCDFGAQYRGYHSDETHTFFINKPDSDAKKLYLAVRAAHDRAIDAAKPGMKASELDRVARGFLDLQGYGKYFGHALGHGVGLDVHESPSISYRSKDILKRGMVFTIEPGVYIQGWGGIRIESMVYLSNNGKEVLTKRHNPVINPEV
jgi:Xaa-Pro aminopeptidase